MDTRTGEIISMKEVLEKPKSEQKWFKELPPKEYDEVEGMNRAERRRWYSLNKKRLEKEKNVSRTA